MTTTTTDANLTAALDYATRGWRVVPIPRGLKHPNRPGWQDAATTDEQLIRQWWTEHPDHGVGIATGAETGLWVLDVDTGPGKAGEDTLADLEATYGALPDTLEVITGSGGRHLYFAWPAGAEIRNDQAGRLGPGLDIRGTGGQVLAPPTIHPNGRAYEWSFDSGEDVADAPGWLLELLTVPTRDRPRLERKPPAERPDGVKLPGDRFEAETSWGELLAASGAVHVDTRTDHNTGHTYELWSRPPMAGEADFRPHTSATLNYAGGDVLKVFSSNWIVTDVDRGSVTRLDADATYTRFGYWAAHHHSGDHAAAASALANHYADAAIAEWSTGDGIAPPVIEVDTRPPAPALGIRWVDELADQMPPEPPIIVEGILRAGELAAIAAPRAIGKTWLSYNLATLLAEGEGQFLGSLDVRRKARVLYLQGELDEWGSAVRWKMLTGISRPLPHIGETFERLRLRTLKRQMRYVDAGIAYTDEHIDAQLPDSLEAAIAEHSIDLVIVDPWAVYFAGNENSNDEAEAVLGALRQVTLRTGVAWLIVHHITGKAERSTWTEPEDLWRGATRLGDWASTRITVLPHYTETARKEAGMDRHDARRHVDIHVLRRNGEPVPTLHARRRSDGWWERWEPAEEVAVGGTSLLAMVKAIDLEGGEVGSTAALAKLLAVSHDTARKLVDEASSAGIVTIESGKHGAKVVRLTDDAPSPWKAGPGTSMKPSTDLAKGFARTNLAKGSRGQQTPDQPEHDNLANLANDVARSEDRESAGHRPREPHPSPTGRGPREDGPHPSGEPGGGRAPARPTTDAEGRAALDALLGAPAIDEPITANEPHDDEDPGDPTT